MASSLPVTSPMLIVTSQQQQQQQKHNNCININNNNIGGSSNVSSGCLTSDIGPDLEPILTVESPKRREAFEKAYRVGPIIGKGGFGKVFAGERLKDRLPVAIKHINKSKISSWCTVSHNQLLFYKHNFLKCEYLRCCKFTQTQSQNEIKPF